jgi:hypothetical protein
MVNTLAVFYNQQLGRLVIDARDFSDLIADGSFVYNVNQIDGNIAFVFTLKGALGHTAYTTPLRVLEYEERFSLIQK